MRRRTRLVFERRTPGGPGPPHQRYLAGGFIPACLLFHPGRPLAAARIRRKPEKRTQEEFSNVDCQPARTQTAQPEDVQERLTRPRELPAAPWRLHARLHD